jgi:hypothetical protein
MAALRRRTVKATFTLDAELVVRVTACAALRGLSRDAFATAAFEEAIKGLVLFDRGRKSDRSASKDRPILAPLENNSETEAA